jgi:type II secretory pathway component PulJ
MISRHGRNRPALTLLEVILAVVLVLGLTLTLFAMYDAGLGIRSRALQRMEFLAAERLVMEQMTAELRSAMVYPFLETSFEGTADQARWPAAMAVGQEVWLEDDTDEPAAPQSDVQVVGYRLRTTEDEQGEPVVLGLERTCQKVLTAQILEEGQAGQTDDVAIGTELLSEHIKYLRFRYHDGNTWIESDQWNAKDLPAAVEITLGAEPLDEDMTHEEYPHQTFRRRVFIPAGWKTQRGNRVRGLGGGR